MQDPEMDHDLQVENHWFRLKTWLEVVKYESPELGAANDSKEV